MAEKKDVYIIARHQIGDREGNRDFWKRFDDSFSRFRKDGYCWEDRIDLFEYYLNHEYN